MKHIIVYYLLISKRSFNLKVKFFDFIVLD
jgi:hypothetical protein